MPDENFESKANDLLTQLGQFLQVGELEFDEEDDTCTLILDNTLEINITLNMEGETLILHHLVGIVPQENRQEILEQLLEANLFWSGTKGATISIERRSSSVFVMRSITLYDSDGRPLTGEDLGNAIADLANAAQYTKSLLVADAEISPEENQEEKNDHQAFDIAKLD